MVLNIILNVILMSANVQARHGRGKRSEISFSTCGSDFDASPFDFKKLCLEKPPCPPLCAMPDPPCFASPCGPAVTPCNPGFCDLPFNCFTSTCAYKFTEAVYLTIRNLLLPNINFCKPTPCGVRFYEKSNSNLESEIAKLLGNILSTVPPEIFHRYYDAFRTGNYYECYLLLQRYFNPESAIERSIIDCIISRNRANRRRNITAICFVDICTKECSVIELPGCVCDDRVCLYLPRQCLKFEEFICLPFSLDEALICEIDYFVPVGFRKFYKDILIRYFKCFRNLTIEQKIVWWLRIKFFVFNSIGYAVSYLSSGAKNNVLDLLIRTATSENDAFYLSYARCLGIIGNK